MHLQTERVWMLEVWHFIPWIVIGLTAGIAGIGQV